MLLRPPFPEHYPSFSEATGERVRERYMLSEMGNKGVKTRSARCDSKKGRLVRRGRG